VGEASVCKTNGVVVGHEAKAQEESCVVIGQASTSSQGSSRTVVIGRQAATFGEDTVVVGEGSSVFSPGGMAIGAQVINGDIGSVSCVIGNATLNTIRNTGDNTCDLGTTAARFKDVYSGGDVSCATLNTLTPIGGVASRITNVVYIGNATEDIFGTAGTDYVGSLAITPRMLTVGSTFSLKASGTLTANNGRDIRFLGLTNQGSQEHVVFDTGNMRLDAQSNRYWEMENEITVRLVNGQASFVASGNFGQAAGSANTWSGVGWNNIEAFDPLVVNNLRVFYITGDLDVSMNLVMCVLTKKI